MVGHEQVVDTFWVNLLHFRKTKFRFTSSFCQQVFIHLWRPNLFGTPIESQPAGWSCEHVAGSHYRCWLT